MPVLVLMRFYPYPQLDLLWRSHEYLWPWNQSDDRTVLDAYVVVIAVDELAWKDVSTLAIVVKLK